MSAKYVPNIPVYKQGNGVINVAGAWDLLRALGCDLAQGYLIGKPMWAGELPQWAKTHRAAMKSLAATIDSDGKAGKEAETRRDGQPVKLVAAGGKLAS